jgi:hypothetical protein
VHITPTSNIGINILFAQRDREKKILEKKQNHRRWRKMCKRARKKSQLWPPPHGNRHRHGHQTKAGSMASEKKCGGLQDEAWRHASSYQFHIFFTASPISSFSLRSS